MKRSSTISFQIVIVLIASIPFFVVLYQAFKVLGYAGQNKVFSQEAVKALRTIKYCAMAIIGLIAVGEIFIIFGNSDDRAGGMGVLITFGSVVTAIAAAKFERILQNAVNKRDELGNKTIKTTEAF